ncbi:MAG: PorT family protein [Candidatus Symbiothrix sp.]|jgi:hypothetical protein|nr:PorT family protein [Candidatus Symbiothrix sp.]
MKKYLLIALVALTAVTANAQGVKFGVTAGLNLSNWTGDIEDAKYKAGFQVGVVADWALTESFSIAPELNFSQKGYKAKFEGIGAYDISATVNYLTLPINALYKFNVSDDSKFLVFAGPYLGYGLSGSVKATVPGEGSESEDIKFGSKEGELKAFDFGLNAGIGFQYTKFFIKAQYNLGLANLSNVDGNSIKNSNIGVTLGYLF